MKQKKIEFRTYSFSSTPEDYLEHQKRMEGICGLSAIASLLGTSMGEVLEVFGINQDEFKGYTTEKEMRKILGRFGYDVKRRHVKDKHSLPDCDFGIIRVSFGDIDQVWYKTMERSHYVAIKRFERGRFIYDNLDTFDNQKVNGVWIHEREYPLLMSAENMFVTSYLEVKFNENN